MRKNDCKVACGLFYGGAVCGSCAAKTAKLPRHCFAEVSRPLLQAAALHGVRKRSFYEKNRDRGRRRIYREHDRRTAGFGGVCGGKVKNLNAGAADYITKPFDNDELLTRIAVQLRRGGGRGNLRRVAPRPFENYPAPVTGDFAGAARGAYRQMLARPKLQISAPPKIAAGKRELKQKNKDCKTNRANSTAATKSGAQPVKAARNPLKRCATR